MSGYTSTTSLPPTAIRIGSAQELSELSKFAFPCSVKFASSIVLGISSILFFVFILLIPYTPAISMKASVCVKTAQAVITYANTQEIARINADTNILIEYGAIITTDAGTAIITHFDGSTEELPPYTEITLASDKGQREMGVFFWLQRALFNTELPTDYTTIASTYG